MRKYTWTIICSYLIGFSVIGFIAGFLGGLVTVDSMIPNIPKCSIATADLWINGTKYQVRPITAEAATGKGE